MAEPGWYPDPEGAPGRYRYWDGRRWAAESVENPQDDPLLAAGQDPAPAGRGRRMAILITGVLVVVAVVAAAIFFLVRPGRGAVTDPNPPSPSVTGWDDSSPTASARPSSSTSSTSTAPSASPSASRSSSPSSSPSSTTSSASSASPTRSAATVARPAAHCPTGEPGQSVQHPGDGRVYGGDLSFASVSGGGFGAPKADDSFGWWYDEHAQVAALGSGRKAVIAVGTVAIQSGFQTPAEAARSSLLCAISAGDYSGYTGHRSVRSGSTTVDGQQAAEFVADVTVKATGGYTGDRVTVVVVNAGPPGSYSIFLATAPIGDSTRAALISRAVQGLKVG